MENTRLIQKFNDYKRALQRLGEVLAVSPEFDYVYDAAIQRFEFTYELSLKLLKGFLSYNGIADVMTPREALKEAFAAGMIQDGETWIEMLKERNVTSHVYDEKQARDIYQHIKDHYFGLFTALAEQIAKELAK